LKLIDLTNLRFGRLTVKKYLGDIKWLCTCDCKNTVIVETSNLKRSTRSCGCLARELLTTHGMSKTRQYSIWLDMRKRCDNPMSISYPHYGGRGITYSKEWQSFQVFWEDMQSTYLDTLTLDRLDSNGDYCKLNCKWSSFTEQASNKRKYKSNTLGISNIFLARNGKVLRCKLTKDNKGYVKDLYLNDYSFNDAVKLLIEWRDKMRISLDFGKFHGK
jgi:hypothetical protein